LSEKEQKQTNIQTDRKSISVASCKHLTKIKPMKHGLKINQKATCFEIVGKTKI
jgi:hypothetical protein